MDGNADGNDRPAESDTVHASMHVEIAYDHTVLSAFAQTNRASRPTLGSPHRTPRIRIAARRGAGRASHLLAFTSTTGETFSDSIKDDYFEAIQPDGGAVPEQYAETRQSVYICRAWSVGAPAPQRAPSRTNPHVVAYCRTHLGKPF